ncbi:hypothetical protein Fmac_001959 [Flemingia macrophylla]|uniref:NADH dehydrogenase subunit 5 n=1 Tax=Flemingia macrophylla TaxID=520843 RepID=A0ABD1NIK5_9FABA
MVSKEGFHDPLTFSLPLSISATISSTLIPLFSFSLSKSHLSSSFVSTTFMLTPFFSTTPLSSSFFCFSPSLHVSMQFPMIDRFCYSSINQCTTPINTSYIAFLTTN